MVEIYDWRSENVFTVKALSEPYYDNIRCCTIIDTDSGTRYACWIPEENHWEDGEF